MQLACPWVHVFVHVDEHAAFGWLPEQHCVPGHVDVEATYRHPIESTMHVASVFPPWHAVPAAVQSEELHVHAAELPAPLHVWCAPQVMVVVHPVQPFACIVHVWTRAPPGVHSVRPAVH